LNETYFVGNVDEASKQLVRCTYECLEKAIAIGDILCNLTLLYSIYMPKFLNKTKGFPLLDPYYVFLRPSGHTCKGYLTFELKHIRVQLNLEFGSVRLEKS
jgi:hypothetical protein